MVQDDIGGVMVRMAEKLRRDHLCVLTIPSFFNFSYIDQIAILNGWKHMYLKLSNKRSEFFSSIRSILRQVIFGEQVIVSVLINEITNVSSPSELYRIINKLVIPPVLEPSHEQHENVHAISLETSKGRFKNEILLLQFFFFLFTFF
jgi:hypothetical protein